MAKAKVIVQPTGNHTNIKGLIGKKIEFIGVDETTGGINIRFAGRGGREPFLEIHKGVFYNGKKDTYTIGTGAPAMLGLHDSDEAVVPLSPGRKIKVHLPQSQKPKAHSRGAKRH